MKPDNFLMGLSLRPRPLIHLQTQVAVLISAPLHFCCCPQVYVIDFGLAKKYQRPHHARTHPLQVRRRAADTPAVCWHPASVGAIGATTGLLLGCTHPSCTHQSMSSV